MRWIKYAPDRLLHRRRRDAGIAVLRRKRDIRRLLFVCHGNICRSPYAHHALAARIADAGADGPHVESSGFLDGGRPVAPEAISAARARGVDLSEHVSRQLTAGAVTWADVVFVMDSAQRRALGAYGAGMVVLLLGDFDPQDIETRRIPDPVDQAREVFGACYDRIDRCVGVVVDALLAR